jgi:hypothetical protein
MYAAAAAVVVLVAGLVLARNAFRSPAPAAPVAASAGATPTETAPASPDPAPAPSPETGSAQAAAPAVAATPPPAAGASTQPAVPPNTAKRATAARGASAPAAPAASAPVLESSPIGVTAAPPVATTPPAAALPPLIFAAQTVLVEGGRNRQRDTIVRVANGEVIVTDRENKPVTSVPMTAVVGFTYSNTRQPLWNSPQGPAEIVHIEGGAFGFLRGDQHWVSLRTDSMSLVLRVREQDSRRVVAGIEERLGRPVERVSEVKER